MPPGQLLSLSKRSSPWRSFRGFRLSATEWQLSQLLWLPPCSFRPGWTSWESWPEKKHESTFEKHILQQMSPNTMFRKGTSHHNIKYQTFFWLQWKKNWTFSPFSTAQLDPRWLPCKLGGRPNSFLPFSACAEQRTAISHVVRKSWRTQRYGWILLFKKNMKTHDTHTFAICIDNEHNIIYNDYH